ncbi:MAG TPA: hypothetical protein VKV23_08145 [Acidimicrobiales bacterium]|nr:hypothetical protein [Acidimicrobiales bacterium]
MPNLLRFEGPTKEAAAAKLFAALGEGARIVRAGRERSGGVLGFFQREVFVLEAEPPAERAGTVLAPLAAAVERTEDTLATSAGGAFESAFSEVLEEAEEALAAAAAAPAGEARRPLEAFRRLGLAEALCPLEGEAVGESLLARLSRLERPPELPTRPGSVVVVVGAPAGALRLARLVRARLAPGDAPVLTVAPRPRRGPADEAIADPLDAATAVAARRIARQPCVVAVAARTPDHDFVADVVAGVVPDACWAVLPASCDEATIEALAAATGGIDALSIYGLDEATQPARHVGGALPLAYVEFHAATPLLLAAYLAELAGVDW